MPHWIRKPRIRSLLLLANLLLLALPLGGLWMLRLYESALVRQTETELIAQAAVISAAYRAAWRGPWAGADDTPRIWAPRAATLDLARNVVLPAPLPATPPVVPADSRAVGAGLQLSPVLADAQRVTLAGMRVLDRHGIVVASSREEMGLSLAAQEEVAAALSGREAAVLRQRNSSSKPPAGPASISRGAALRVFVAQPVLDEGAVIGAVLLSRTPASLEQVLYGKRWEMMGLALALLAAAGALAAFVAYTVGRPIQAVTAQARAVASGARVSLHRPRRSAVREADELWAAIHSMAETLERRADYIGAFAAEVSHEFKTPLAALRGGLELLQDHVDTMSVEERARFLSHADEDAARLERLVRRLLELARAEAPMARIPERCDVGAVVREAASKARVSVHLDAPVEPVHAAIGAEQLRMVLMHLLDNVHHHAGEMATARICWVAMDQAVRIIVSDDGKGISARNAGKVFDRFFTTARDTGGTGLGLPIARSSLEASGGSIRLDHDEARTTFLITLPG